MIYRFLFIGKPNREKNQNFMEIAGIKSRKGKERTDIPCATLENEDHEFVEFIKNYNFVSRPVVMELLHKYSHKRIIIFENRNDANEFLS